MAKRNDMLIAISHDNDIYIDRGVEQVLGALISVKFNWVLPLNKPGRRFVTRRWGENAVQEGGGFIWISNPITPDRWDYFGRRILREAFRASYNGTWKPGKSVRDRMMQIREIMLVVVLIGVVGLGFLAVFGGTEEAAELPPQPTYSGIPTVIPDAQIVNPDNPSSSNSASDDAEEVRTAN